jgi:hypothetical protein
LSRVLAAALCARRFGGESIARIAIARAYGVSDFQMIRMAARLAPVLDDGSTASLQLLAIERWQRDFLADALDALADSVSLEIRVCWGVYEVIG